ncbi:MAG: GHKL domain-containing protein [Bacteroidales bacterium]|jgi:signal transduction histidine kinase|nr:GHKL domain-containing protein [Bacteroidales bacterium]
MKRENNKIILLFAITFAVSVAIGFVYSVVKQHNAKTDAITAITDIASEKDESAEDLLKKAMDKNDVSILNNLRRRYHVETMLCAVNDTINVSNMAEPQNASAYFRSRLSGRRIDSAHHIYNVSENATKHYVGYLETADSVLFMEIESHRIASHSAFADITLTERKREVSYNEKSDISYAKYEDSLLIWQSGNFPYPQRNTLISGQWQRTSHHYLHYSLQSQNPHQQWVVTIHSNLWYDTLIGSSAIFLLMLIVTGLAFLIRKFVKREALSQRTLVFLVITGLFLAVFVVLGWISILNVRDMNTEAYTDVLKEKTLSINIEISTFMSQNDSTNALSDYVLRLSNAFFVDINIFDSKGMIMVSSKPRVFEEGVVPKQMNINAFRQLSGAGSRYVSPILVQSEMFRQRRYLSAYMPIVNEEDRVVAYLNIPFISQQRELDERIKSMISNFAGVYLLVVSVVILLAALISNILTNIRKNERDKAWKELAKQVAHEVKNPLTPMKLSIQHLVRLKDSGDKQFDNKFSAVSSSLIEQIDTLSGIASEFSDYSRIQDPELQKVNVVLCLQSAVAMFSSNDSLSLNLNLNNYNEVLVSADKALLIRTFNNLLKNAVQALSNREDGRINVDLRVMKRRCIVTIEDNGCGISPENQAKIFVDSFTTKNDGSGLGLVIVRNTIESFKGTLRFSSKEGKGTSFIVSLPLNHN